MNKKAIKSILEEKHMDFVSSIDDPKVAELVRNHSIITGGAITSMLLDEQVNDFDYYFETKEVCEAVANYYVKKFNANSGAEEKLMRVNVNEDRVQIFIASSGVAFDSEFNEVVGGNYIAETESKDGKYRPVFFTSNAITLTDKIQLVLRFYGTPEEIHKNYDFAHCTNYWYSKTGELVLQPKALESILSRELEYIGSKYPLSSIIRTRKFINRGWHINAGQYVKMALQLNKMDLTDPKVLEDQLVGVDITYFQTLISAINSKREKDPDFEITDTYISSIIDKIF